MMWWLACVAPTEHSESPDPQPEPTESSPTPSDSSDSADPATGETGTPPPADPLSTWADEVVSAPGQSDAPFGDPALAVNGARGAGSFAGGVDVYALGANDDDATLVVRWSGRRLVDGPGTDLVVFENAFDVAPGVRFMDPAVVEVSADGTHFVAFAHSYEAAEASEWSADPSVWVGFAGVTPVLLHESDLVVDPFDPIVAGGDGFDLADLDPVAAAEVLALGVLSVRITSALAAVNPETGQFYPHDPVANGSDIDAVYGRMLVWE